MRNIRATIARMKERHWKDERIKQLLDHIGTKEVVNQFGDKVNRWACLECNYTHYDRAVILRHVSRKHPEYALTYTQYGLWKQERDEKRAREAKLEENN